MLPPYKERAIIRALSQMSQIRVLVMEEGWLGEDVTQTPANMRPLPGKTSTYDYFSAISGKGYDPQTEEYSEEQLYPKLDGIVLPDMPKEMEESLRHLCAQNGVRAYPLRSGR